MHQIGWKKKQAFVLDASILRLGSTNYVPIRTMATIASFYNKKILILIANRGLPYLAPKNQHVPNPRD